MSIKIICLITLSKLKSRWHFILQANTPRVIEETKALKTFNSFWWQYQRHHWYWKSAATFFTLGTLLHCKGTFWGQSLGQYQGASAYHTDSLLKHIQGGKGLLGCNTELINSFTRELLSLFPKFLNPYILRTFSPSIFGDFWSSKNILSI